MIKDIILLIKMCDYVCRFLRFSVNLWLLALHQQAMKILERAFHDRWVLLKKFKFYLLLFISFLVFLKVNQGVVLGKSNH